MKKIVFGVMFLTMAVKGFSQPTPLHPLTQPGKVDLQNPKINNIITPLVTKVAFEADITREISSPSSTLHFDAVKYNDGNGFSAAQNVFIVPTSGLYFFSVNLIWNGFGCTGGGGSSSVSAIKNGREGLFSAYDQATSSGIGGFSSVLNFTTKLVAGDKVSINVVNTICDIGGGSLPILRKGLFSGYLIAAD